MTVDFRREMEKVSGKNLKAFFNQWLFIKGHPELKWNWSYRDGKLHIFIEQIQKHHTFKFPIEIGIVNDDSMETETVLVDSKTKTFEIAVNSKPDNIVLDPDLWLLFEEKQ